MNVYNAYSLRLTALLLAACACLIFARPACAAADIPDDQEARRSPAAVLEIANNYVGDDMDGSYAQGYMPVVSDGHVHVVLPLRSVSTDDAPDAISVLVGLGNTDSPFVFQNYDLRVPRTQPDEGAEDLYLVAVDLTLTEPASGGRYPVSFTCTGRTPSGNGFSQLFTVYVTVPEESMPEDPTDLPGEEPVPDPDPDPDPGFDPDPVSDPGGDPGYTGGGDGGGTGGSVGSPAEPTQAPQPKLMVLSQSVSPSHVSAGDGFSLTISLRNTSSSVPASNLLITAEGDQDVYPADGSGSAYFAKAAAGETFSFTVQMASSPEAPPGPKKVTIHAGYDGPQGTGYTQDDAITVQVTQPVRFAVDEPEIPDSVPAGEVWSIPLNVMNLGRATIRNVSASVDAPGVRTQTTLFLGNLESGTARKGTLYAYVGPKSDEEGKARYGNTEGTIIVSCEDEYGAVHSETLPFRTSIEAPIIRSERTADEDTPEEEESVMQWQASLGIGAAIAGGAAALWLWARRKERKRLDEDE